MYTDTKVLNKILANKIQKHIKIIIYHNLLRLIPKMQDCLTFTNKHDMPH